MNMDDALDRLEALLHDATTMPEAQIPDVANAIEEEGLERIATVREALERQRSRIWLAQIEERMSFYDEDGEWVYLSAEERDALVEIAKAARVLLDEYEDEETEHGFPFNFALRDAHRSLRSALARLDSGAAEEDA